MSSLHTSVHIIIHWQTWRDIYTDKHEQSFMTEANNTEITELDILIDELGMRREMLR